MKNLKKFLKHITQFSVLETTLLIFLSTITIYIFLAEWDEPFGVGTELELTPMEKKEVDGWMRDSTKYRHRQILKAKDGKVGFDSDKIIYKDNEFFFQIIWESSNDTIFLQADSCAVVYVFLKPKNRELKKEIHTAFGYVMPHEKKNKNDLFANISDKINIEKGDTLILRVIPLELAPSWVDFKVRILDKNQKNEFVAKRTPDLFLPSGIFFLLLGFLLSVIFFSTNKFGNHKEKYYLWNAVYLFVFFIYFIVFFENQSRLNIFLSRYIYHIFKLDVLDFVALYPVLNLFGLIFYFKFLENIVQSRYKIEKVTDVKLNDYFKKTIQFLIFVFVINLVQNYILHRHQSAALSSVIFFTISWFFGMFILIRILKNGLSDNLHKKIAPAIVIVGGSFVYLPILFKFFYINSISWHPYLILLPILSLGIYIWLVLENYFKDDVLKNVLKGIIIFGIGVIFLFSIHVKLSPEITVPGIYSVLIFLLSVTFQGFYFLKSMNSLTKETETENIQIKKLNQELIELRNLVMHASSSYLSNLQVRFKLLESTEKTSIGKDIWGQAENRVGKMKAIPSSLYKNQTKGFIYSNLKDLIEGYKNGCVPAYFLNKEIKIDLNVDESITIHHSLCILPPNFRTTG